jgi:polyisoprenoid-binding protein YceI
MKKTFLFLSITLSLFIVSCKSGSKEASNSNSEHQEVVATKKFKIDNVVSTLEWKCGKLVGGSHSGNVSFIDGELNGTDTKIISGKLDIDMKSISCSDIEDKAKNADLVGHLKSADFFDVEKNPTSILEILKVEDAKEKTVDANSTIIANLTIKGVTKEITFPAMIKYSDLGLLATASFKINRKDWGMNYGTEGSVADLAKDRIINNEIEFVVSILAEEVK